jgi:hypothetical protein
MSPFFIDFEAFQHGDGKFRIKELCIMDVEQPLTPLYFLFKAERKWNSLTSGEQQTYSYQQRYLHHLCWEEGRTRYCRKCVWHHIKMQFPECRNHIFYVMGKQKLEFLKEVFPSLNFCEYNITFHQLPQIADNISCFYRYHGEHCACLKCYRLYTHYISLPL